MSTPNYRLAEVIDQWDFDIFSICLVVLLHLGVTQKQLPYLRGASLKTLILRGKKCVKLRTCDHPWIFSQLGKKLYRYFTYRYVHTKCYKDYTASICSVIRNEVYFWSNSPNFLSPSPNCLRYFIALPNIFMMAHRYFLTFPACF